MRITSEDIETHFGEVGEGHAVFAPAPAEKNGRGGKEGPNIPDYIGCGLVLEGLPGVQSSQNPVCIVPGRLGFSAFSKEATIPAEDGTGRYRKGHRNLIKT